MVEEQRGDERYSLGSIEITVSGIIGKIVDVSARGVLVAGLGNDFVLDSSCTVIFKIPMQGHIVEHNVEGIIARHVDENIGISFDSPTTTWPAILALISIIEEDDE